MDGTIDRINDKGKGIDVLVNNAVISLIGVLEDLSRDEIKAEFETSLFGAIIVMKTVLHIVRKQQGETTVQILTLHDLTILC
jgi:NAD(P)-dependent dehydrogenase (short-subunit alcohol dehydrogenase family)